MKYLSLFSGVGGFELGVGDQHECIGFSEIDKYATQVYKKHFNHKEYGDITKINAKELPDFDLLVGGFPDDWTAEGVDGSISDTQRYKMMGNAVTVNVIRDIIKKLL